MERSFTHFLPISESVAAFEKKITPLLLDCVCMCVCGYRHCPRLPFDIDCVLFLQFVLQTSTIFEGKQTKRPIISNLSVRLALLKGRKFEFLARLENNQKVRYADIPNRADWRLCSAVDIGLI